MTAKAKAIYVLTLPEVDLERIPAVEGDAVGLLQIL